MDDFVWKPITIPDGSVTFLAETGQLITLKAQEGSLDVGRTVTVTKGPAPVKLNFNENGCLEIWQDASEHVTETVAEKGRSQIETYKAPLTLPVKFTLPYIQKTDAPLVAALAAEPNDRAAGRSLDLTPKGIEAAAKRQEEKMRTAADLAKALRDFRTKIFLSVPSANQSRKSLAIKLLTDYRTRPAADRRGH